MEVKYVHYVGMVFVATEMPLDKPVLCGVVTQNGELRASWRDPEYRGDDRMMLDFNKELGKAMISGEIPIPIFTFIHPANEQSNKAIAKADFQMEKVLRDGVEWNMWFLGAERTKAIMEFRKRFLEATSDEERVGVLDEYVNDFEKAIKNKNKLKEVAKVK